MVVVTGLVLFVLLVSGFALGVLSARLLYLRGRRDSEEEAAIRRQYLDRHTTLMVDVSALKKWAEQQERLVTDLRKDFDEAFGSTLDERTVDRVLGAGERQRERNKPSTPSIFERGGVDRH